MIQKLERELKKVSANPPWVVRNRRRSLQSTHEGIGAPEPGEYDTWQEQINSIKSQLERARAEEDARRMIDRP